MNVVGAYDLCLARDQLWTNIHGNGRPVTRPIATAILEYAQIPNNTNNYVNCEAQTKLNLFVRLSN